MYVVTPLSISRESLLEQISLQQLGKQRQAQGSPSDAGSWVASLARFLANAGEEWDRLGLTMSVVSGN